jgi:beta-glucosidase/6-phospho-beta-glucosidase/beta-galactosidase
MSICDLGYGQGVFAPGIKGGAAGQYKCGHNLLLAHAKTVKLYREKYMGAQDGKISMALDGKYGYPLTDSAADKQAAQYCEYTLRGRLRFGPAGGRGGWRFCSGAVGMA